MKKKYQICLFMALSIEARFQKLSSDVPNNFAALDFVF